MISLNKFRLCALQSIKCTGCTALTFPRTLLFVHHVQTVATEPQKADIITNLSEKLCCTENVAKNIYIKFPLMRSVNLINDETLTFLRTKVSPKSIVENPTLITTDVDILKRKIKVLDSMEPKNLDDFAPLLTLDEKKLNKLAAKFSKDKQENRQQNRIYFLSDKLKFEPNVISKHIANCNYDLFSSSFRSFKKKINILLDYGMKPMNILKGLYILRYDDSVFVRRSEQMLSLALPIKVGYLKLSEEEFDQLIEQHNIGDDKQIALSANMTRQLKKRNREKAVIVKSLNSLLKCNDLESSEIYYNYVNEMNELESAKRNIAYLLKLNFKLEIIRKNGFLLSMPLDEIQEKLGILKLMKPKNIEDFIPLMNVNTTVLEEYKCYLVKEQVIDSAHPIYYFSEKLQIPASVVAAQFAQHNIVFLKHPLNLLKPKLDVLLQHDVNRESILSCQNTFKLGAEHIEGIICNLKSKGFDQISSWMIIPVNSPEYNKLVSKHMKEKNSLGGFESNVTYLAHRLNWDHHDLIITLKKYPKLKNCSASNIKKHLDFFLNETQFTAEDIKSQPYVLFKGIDEYKLRIEEMTKIGITITLPAIYQSNTRYLKSIRKYFVTKPNDAVLTAIAYRLKNRNNFKRWNSIHLLKINK